ncbi:hypothetical protein RF11_02886 [Thelohanellus kitauei]|uniref:Uncharacterized protein n=1 Tax=Thelohanellus kitauei TaxID=669202 RepID=A0A0C2JRK5_THEKT|nr:hypothetical protein RF11_02886 [Thelohanellus kitauei]
MNREAAQKTMIPLLCQSFRHDTSISSAQTAHADNPGFHEIEDPYASIDGDESDQPAQLSDAPSTVAGPQASEASNTIYISTAGSPAAYIEPDYEPVDVYQGQGADLSESKSTSNLEFDPEYDPYESVANFERPGTKDLTPISLGVPQESSGSVSAPEPSVSVFY